MKTIKFKFRGKIKYNGNHRFSGDWVYGYYWYHEIENKHYIKESEDIDGLGTFLHEDFEVDPETVGQYTGLEDIYVGDILDLIRDWNCNGEVVFRQGQFMVKLDGKQKQGYDSLSLLLANPIKRLGNKHDNPELLD